MALLDGPFEVPAPRIYTEDPESFLHAMRVDDPEPKTVAPYFFVGNTPCPITCDLSRPYAWDSMRNDYVNTDVAPNATVDDVLDALAWRQNPTAPEPKGHETRVETTEWSGEWPTPTYQAVCSDCEWRGLPYGDGDQCSGLRAADGDAEWHTGSTFHQAWLRRYPHFAV